MGKHKNKIKPNEASEILKKTLQITKGINILKMREAVLKGFK